MNEWIGWNTYGNEKPVAQASQEKQLLALLAGFRLWVTSYFFYPN
jgi:hypothetical protein